MECGDAGHILLSKHVAEDLGEYEQCRPLLYDLRTREVKHGVRVGVVNLYDNGVGNPQLPKKFQALKKRRTHIRWAEAAIALLVLGAAALVLLLFLTSVSLNAQTKSDEDAVRKLPESFCKAWAKHDGHASDDHG